ncbi:MAG: hypothetical protein L3J42_01650 [Hydrogenimonas sp.]|nr:hypothetical protein [Hydrogenimonas sp.]
MRKSIPDLNGKRVLLYGKNRTLSSEDMELFLDSVGATLAKDESDEDIGLVIRGRLMNPVEESLCDEMERKGVSVVDIETLENHYASTIDKDVLLGSLKIFRNRERIIKLLHNRSISDDLFCEILKLYDWEGKGPFESDENRDIAGTMVARFYKDIERNHNIEFSPVGPFLVAAESENVSLLEAIYMIPDYEITQRSKDYWMPSTLHEALLVNPNLPKSIVESFAKGDNERKLSFAAAHPNLSEGMQRELAATKIEKALEGLAKNRSLTKDLYDLFYESEDEKIKCTLLKYQPLAHSIFSELKSYSKESKRAIGGNIHLKEEDALKLFESGDIDVIEAMAKNEALTATLYEKIESTGQKELLKLLAANPSVEGKLLRRLLKIRDKELYIAIAANPSTPKEVLSNFSKIKDRDIAAALASNPSTPIEILLGYQMDAELSNILKRNEAFGDYIKESIGWQ